MIKKAIQIGDKRVRAKSRPVALRDIRTQTIKTVIKNLVDSMRHYNLVGMAAPQIGINLNIFVTEIRKTTVRKNVAPEPVRIFINPKLSDQSEQRKAMIEGCGTVDYGNIFGPVLRHTKVRITALNENGEKVNLFAQGLMAQIIQHKYDHLLGILCIDRFTDTRKIAHKEILTKFKHS